MPKITKRFVDGIEPKIKPFAVYDDSLKGFGLRVQPTGVATFFVEYRRESGGRGSPKKRLSLGRIGELTPDEARTMARDHLAAVRKGHDPMEARQAKRRELTVRELVDEWEKKPEGKRGPLAPRTVKFMLGRLRAHVVPLIGSKKIGSVTTADVNAMVRQITKGETKRDDKSGKLRGRLRVTGGEASARRTAADLAAIYNYAIDRGHVRFNPTVGVKKPSAKQRRDFLRPEEMSKIVAALDQLEAEGNVGHAGITILRLLMMTGARPSEIESLRWDEVDFEARCLRLKNTKTGHSVRPLSSASMMLIAEQPRVEGSPYVFPATRGNGYFMGSKRIWTKARTLAGLPDKVRYHARHSVATLSLADGADIVSVAAILGHANPRTTLMTYSHVTDKAAEAAEKIGNRIDAIMKRKPSADVIPLVKKNNVNR